MKKYAIAVFAVSILGGILDMLSSGALKSAEKLAIGMITLYVVLSPLTSLGNLGEKDFVNIFEAPDIEHDKVYVDRAEEAFCLGISRAVAEKFNIDTSQVRVSTRNFDFENMRAEKIFVVLSDGAITSDYRAIESYINDMKIGVCECEIEIR